MIRIFNIQTGKAIKIGEDANVFISPKDYYDENPHLEIKLEHIDFHRHSFKCKDCESFINSFGTITKDWYIEYLDKTRRLNLESFGKKATDNFCIYTISDVFNGTTLKLNIDTDTIESLQEELNEELSIQNFEGCTVIYEKMQSLKNLNGSC